jgi:DNA-binding MarR family transcriptional regulator
MRGLEKIAAIDAVMPRIGAVAEHLPIRETMLMRMMLAVTQSFMSFMGDLLRPHGFTDSSFHTLVLLFVGADGKASPSLLCELAGQTPANMTRILDSLKKQGHVSRGSDSGDGRRRVVRITAKGSRCIQQLLPALAPSIRSALTGLSTDAMSQLERLLKDVIVSVDDARHQAQLGS